MAVPHEQAFEVVDADGPVGRAAQALLDACRASVANPIDDAPAMRRMALQIGVAATVTAARREMPDGQGGDAIIGLAFGVGAALDWLCGSNRLDGLRAVGQYAMECYFRLDAAKAQAADRLPQ